MVFLILWLFVGSPSDSLIRSVSTIPGVSGFMIYQNGVLKQERYWRGGWDRDPKGIYFGGNNMSLSPAGLLAFGRMYMDAGRYDDVQVVRTTSSIR